MRKRSLKVVVVTVGLGILIGGAGLVVANRPVQVSVARVERDIPVKVFGLGTVEARVLSKVGFEVSAALVALEADHGDMVASGEVLARLHPAEQEAKVARAKAGVLSAEAEVGSAEANVEKARAVLAQSELANRRVQALVERGTVTEEKAEEAQRDEDVARAGVSIALSEIEVVEARVADARAQFELERILLGHHTLTAPFDAMVVERHQELGAVVGVGEAIFTLIDPASVWVLAYVDEARAGPVRVGQPAEVRLRSLPQQSFPARVVRIGIESDRVSEERRVYVKCEQCPDRFHLGEQAEVLIEVATLDQALLVPEAAVRGFDGARGRVWTVEDGVLHQREVVFGHRTTEALLEIVDGLPPGARVVSRIGGGLREGRRAWIADENSGGGAE